MTTLNFYNKTSLVHIISLASLDPNINLSCRTRIALLKVDKVFIAILSEFAYFANIFSLNLAIKLLEYTKINNYIIKLINAKQSFYKPIYCHKPIELEILKIYIKIYLRKGFIKPFMSPIYILIIYIQTSDNSLSLCIK